MRLEQRQGDGAVGLEGCDDRQVATGRRDAGWDQHDGPVDGVGDEGAVVDAVGRVGELVDGGALVVGGVDVEVGSGRLVDVVDDGVAAGFEVAGAFFDLEGGRKGRGAGGFCGGSSRGDGRGESAD